MYCPNCGKQNAESQNFCRSCGLALERIAQSLNEQLPTVAVKSLQERKDQLEKWGVASLSVFGLGVIGFLLYMVFSKLWLSQGLFVAALAVLGATLFIGCGLASVILFAKAKELKEATGKRQLAEAAAPERPQLSVTDRTTELLPTNRSGRDTNG